MKRKVLYSNHSIFKENYTIPEIENTQRKVIRVSEQFSVKTETDFQQKHHLDLTKNQVANVSDSLNIVGKKISEKYLIKSAIGSGGMGVIYLATHTILEKKYAIKFLLNKDQSYSDEKELHKRFIKEAEIAIQLRHPNLAEVYDVGIHENNLYMVMEYIDGENIDQILDQKTLFRRRNPKYFS